MAVRFFSPERAYCTRRSTSSAIFRLTFREAQSRRFRGAHSLSPIGSNAAIREATRCENRAASRRARRRLSARYGATPSRAPGAAVETARPRVSAPLAPTSARARRETAERGPRLAEVSRRAESASERFSDAPGGGGAYALPGSGGAHLPFAMASGGLTPTSRPVPTVRTPAAASKLLRARPQ